MPTPPSHYASLLRATLSDVTTGFSMTCNRSFFWLVWTNTSTVREQPSTVRVRVSFQSLQNQEDLEDHLDSRPTIGSELIKLYIDFERSIQKNCERRCQQAQAVCQGLLNISRRCRRGFSRVEELSELGTATPVHLQPRFRPCPASHILRARKLGQLLLQSSAWTLAHLHGWTLHYAIFLLYHASPMQQQPSYFDFFVLLTRSRVAGLVPTTMSSSFNKETPNQPNLATRQGISTTIPRTTPSPISHHP